MSIVRYTVYYNIIRLMISNSIYLYYSQSKHTHTHTHSSTATQRLTRRGRSHDLTTQLPTHYTPINIFYYYYRITIS